MRSEPKAIAPQAYNCRTSPLQAKKVKNNRLMTVPLSNSGLSPRPMKLCHNTTGGAPHTVTQYCTPVSMGPSPSINLPSSSAPFTVNLIHSACLRASLSPGLADCSARRSPCNLCVKQSSGKSLYLLRQKYAPPATSV